MEVAEENLLPIEKDSRNVKAHAEERGKSIGMMMKSYNHKALEKINWSKQERMLKKIDTIKLTEEKNKNKKEEEPLDVLTAKKLKKQKEKDDKIEEKRRNKQEKIRLSQAERKLNGVKHKHNS